MLTGGVDPDRGHRSSPLGEEDLEQRRRASPLAEVLPVMRQALVPVADAAQHIMVVCDADGRVLWREGSAAVLRRADALGFVPGADWSEDVMGTNGVGTPLVVRRPVQVFSAEHFVRTQHAWTCTGAPATDPRRPAVTAARVSGRWATSRRSTGTSNSKATTTVSMCGHAFRRTPTKRGFDSIDPNDLRGRMRWWGLYTQRKPGIDGGKTAVLAPEELDDEYFMLRVRVDGGRLTTEQLRVIGEISEEFARGTADLTDRQNVQYHWIRIEDVPEIWRRLEAVGLQTTEACGDTPRVILGSPVGASPRTRSSTAPPPSTRSSAASSATRTTRTCRASSRPRSPALRSSTSRTRSTTSPSSACTTPSTAPASTSGSAAASPPTPSWACASAPGWPWTTCPTCSAASSASSATMATAGSGTAPA
ncbi:hypothetical protein SALBM135S_07735 [Streptomyces alboniger]